MPMKNTIIFIAGALAIGSYQLALGGDSKSSQNEEIMAAAARQLEYSIPENRAYFLEKQDSVKAQVAVIFGYADNGTACEQIARILSESLGAGPFLCHPVY